jgi:hypothetical protein
LALTPILTLDTTARTDRWRYLLEGQGLAARPQVLAKVRRKLGAAWARIPELTKAVGDAVARLGLVEVAE